MSRKNQDTPFVELSRTDETKGPLIQLAYFVNGKVELLHAHTRQEKYIAISHVWGDKAWRYVPIAGREVLLSKQKVDFIQNELPDLVGDIPFWMDTLTVDQQNPTEVISTVQNIPAIFRDATKTMAIRECDGLYSCCSAAAEGHDIKGLIQSLLDHVWEAHQSHSNEESYLRRLWTLQECLLSHTIQFVTVAKGSVVKNDSKLIYDPFRTQTEFQRAVDSLEILAESFCVPSSNSSATNTFEFVKAYLSNGTVTRGLPPLRNPEEDIYSQSFKDIHRASERSATMPRDYIFATMPQFPWYRYPAEAESMTFSEIFANFYTQAKSGGHVFICRVTKSMTELESCTSYTEAWEPSSRLWDPTTLSDFLKLFGGKVDHRDHVVPNPLFAQKIRVKQIEESELKDAQRIFEILKSTMSATQLVWAEAQRGGELTRHGSWPEGSQIEELRSLVKTYEEAVSNTELSHPRRAYLESIALHHGEELAQWKLKEESEAWIFSYAQQVLANMWGSIDPFAPSPTMKGNWHSFVREMEGKWSRKMLKALIFLAAILSCQLPLSAVDWAQEVFVPIKASCTDWDSSEDMERSSVLGLLSKRTLAEDSSSIQKLLLASRHSEETLKRTDMVILDLSSSIPIGLLPDARGMRHI